MMDYCLIIKFMIKFTCLKILLSCVRMADTISALCLLIVWLPVAVISDRDGKHSDA